MWNIVGARSVHGGPCIGHGEAWASMLNITGWPCKVGMGLSLCWFMLLPAVS